MAIEVTHYKDIYVPELVKEPTFEDTNSPISEKVALIINHQLTHGIRDSSIKGFLFHGEPGLGKTTIAKKIVKDIGAYLIFVDGATIARHRYGDSEKRIKEIFDKAREFGRCIILFDDVESLFMARTAMDLVREWHFSQNSVFFHEVDELDTSKVAIILTTNRHNLVDLAIKDRFYNIEFPLPPIDALVEIMKRYAENHALNPMKIESMEKYILNNKNKFISIRDVLRYVEKEYIDSIIFSKEY